MVGVVIDGTVPTRVIHGPVGVVIDRMDSFALGPCAPARGPAPRSAAQGLDLCPEPIGLRAFTRSGVGHGVQADAL